MKDKIIIEESKIIKPKSIYIKSCSITILEAFIFIITMASVIILLFLNIIKNKTNWI